MVAEAEPAGLDAQSQLTIPGILGESARRHPDVIYLMDGSAEHTFSAVAERVEGARDRLRSLGIGRGDRVVLWLPNGLDWIVTFFAVLRLGATVVPAGTRLRTADLRHILADSGARILVHTPSFLEIDFGQMVAELPRIREAGELLTPECLIAAVADAIPSANPLGEREAGGDGQSGARGPEPDEPAIVCYTSGTTGSPKGCVHSHRALARNARIAARLSGLAPGERIACPVPFAHVFGFHMGVIQAAASGATLVNAEPYAPDRFLDLCESRKATVAYAVPTMAREILTAQLRSPRRLTLRLALVAGAPVSSELRAQITGVGGIAEGLSVAYGCTEAPTISQLLPSDPAPERARSVGRPTPGVEVMIARKGSTSSLPCGETGEILVRGYNTMSGYLGDPAATEGKYRRGWLLTGDLGWLDEDGYLHFASRADEMVLVGGFNAYPREIESQLEQLEGVREAAVIGVPDDRLGQVPMAWVAADPDALDAEHVVDWAHTHLASYKRPRYVEVVEQLPRVPSGKIARARLEERARRRLPSLPWRGARR